jgi:prepilin-type N-terminal cleavage/methylation domain-containing protein
MSAMRSTIHRRIARQAGFTLVEIVTVIAIAAIIMLMSIPSLIDWRRNQNYRATANGINSFMREARSMAISKGLQHQVVFNQVSNCYQLQVYNIATSSFNAASQTLCAPSDVTIRDSSDGTSTAVLTVLFNTNGTATISGPDGPLSGNISVNDNAATQKYLVTVLQTGKISSQRKH